MMLALAFAVALLSAVPSASAQSVSAAEALAAGAGEILGQASACGLDSQEFATRVGVYIDAMTKDNPELRRRSLEIFTASAYRAAEHQAALSGSGCGDVGRELGRLEAQLSVD